MPATERPETVEAAHELRRSLEERDIFDIRDELVSHDPLESDPGLRVRELYNHSNSDAREMILEQVHLMLLARVPVDAIARKYHVSISTVRRWIDEVHTRIRNSPLAFDPQRCVGDTLAHYDGLITIGWQTITSANARDTLRLSHGHSMVRSALADKLKFLQVAGAFDRPHLGGKTVDSGTEAKNLLHGLASEFLQTTKAIRDRLGLGPGDEIVDEDAEAEQELSDNLFHDIEGEANDISGTHLDGTD